MVHVGIHQTVDVLIFPVFKQRLEEMETRLIWSQSTKCQKPTLLSLSPHFTPIFHHLYSLSPPLPHTLHSSFLCLLSSITLSAFHSHFLNSATPPAAFSLCFFYPPPTSPPLLLLLSPPIFVPFGVLVLHVKVGDRFAPLCLVPLLTNEKLA